MTNAKWIWCAGQDFHSYNQAALFKKTFGSHGVKIATLRITADSRYRVSINGQWINDGPGKAYPEHYTYDEYDVSPWIVEGPNLIEVLVRYYGIGTFHQIPQQAGLLAELALDNRTICTDASWLATPYAPLVRWVPKVSCQMEPCELVDARSHVPPKWQAAQELFGARGGPWKDLSLRISSPLGKMACKPVSVRWVVALAHRAAHFCVPVTQFAHRKVIETNHTTSRPITLAASFKVLRPATMECSSTHWRVAIDGQQASGVVSLDAGSYTAVFFCTSFYGHEKELPFPFVTSPGIEWGNWSVFVQKDFVFRDTDILWLSYRNETAERMRDGWMEWMDKTLLTWAQNPTSLPDLGHAMYRSKNSLFMPDYTEDFAGRAPETSINPQVDNASALCLAGEGSVIVDPNGRDVEICYDLGEQRCGYLSFELRASSGTVLDLHLVEYIRPDGVVQHTAGYNRNGMRFICDDGANSYLSLKRRSGRYLFLTLRNMSSRVEIARLEMVESTAAVMPVERFHCNDHDFNRIWAACERTLKMGMEDTFTDCSLYEQTLWIGDARNQALYAANIYGAYEVSQRSLEIGAQSLDRFPIVGCQVPSTWECLLPAWSFLWGVWVWEHYFTTGDREFLQRIFPAVMKNLEGAFNFVDDRGLFTASFWNLLEWADMDQDRPTVIHNSLLLIWACRNAEKCAELLEDNPALDWIRPRRKHLVESVTVWWDPAKKSYPDAILDDGSPSPKICQHNSALAILADALPSGCVEHARKNLLDPPDHMTRINSPFAAQFHFEALEILGERQAILDAIRAGYVPMIAAGATTVWETYPDSTCSPEGFPTRSHCHGWSCGPLQFFNRIILGIRQTQPGGKAFTISPWIGGLQRASGAMATPMGPVHVDWMLEAGKLRIAMDAPSGVDIEFAPNASHDSMEVTVVK